ncbi:hypothetical protein U3516DRAFT_746842 [Neocallimastix sp. 'constans']
MEKNLIIDIKILKYDSSHNHPEKEYDKFKLKLPSNVTTFTEIPNESKYYRTKEYNDDIFVDDTFFIAPKFSYQIFITRTYAKKLDRFYTTSFKIKKRAINKANEISVLIERYKNIETKLIDTKCDRNNTINLSRECIKEPNLTSFIILTSTLYYFYEGFKVLGMDPDRLRKYGLTVIPPTSLSSGIAEILISFRDVSRQFRPEFKSPTNLSYLFQYTYLQLLYKRIIIKPEGKIDKVIERGRTRSP